MPHVTGPQFIALQVENLEAAKQFYTEQLGLIPTDQGPEHAVVFQTLPIPFALRTPNINLADSPRLGWGVALWLGCEQADSLHERLRDYGLEIVEPPFNGPFGRTFSFVDPFGYRLTLHGTPG
ncbi:VOC family protein [Halomonas sp. KG2]|uniref:VOC family protein n=1 Tax=Halomonas sp. KG2 TaxID=2951138 RepID=UPI0026483A61|nr:VOC family protein [Halomonas sp. KG2]WKD27500.1 VOC family protein [Halomonas sp. KG2]